MTMYVIKRLNDDRKGYVTPPGYTNCYTKDINLARIFCSKEEAKEYHNSELEIILHFESELKRSKVK